MRKNFEDKNLSIFYRENNYKYVIRLRIYIKGLNLSRLQYVQQGQAAKTIIAGDSDIMVTAGSESAVCELGLRGFSTIKALSTGNNDPKIVSKPFDKNKDGFVLGEARQH